MFIGAAVSSFYAIATWPRGFWIIIFIGAVIGGVSFLCVRAMQTAVGFLLRGASVRVQRTVITFASVVAGAFGAVLGLVSGVWLAGGHLTIADVLEGRGIPFILATTVIALSSSFIFHWLSRVQSRRSRHSRPSIHQFLPAASLWSMTTKMLPKALPYSLG